MGLIAGIVVAIATLAFVILTLFGSMMSSAPTQSGPSPWPTLIIGGGLSAALIFTHYHPIAW